MRLPNRAARGYGCEVAALLVSRLRWQGGLLIRGLYDLATLSGRAADPPLVAKIVGAETSRPDDQQ